MENMARVGKKLKKTVEEEGSDEDEVEIKDEPEDEDDGNIYLKLINYSFLEEAVLKRERRIAEKEARLREAIPENPADFDRLLTGAANSSDLWIK